MPIKINEEKMKAIGFSYNENEWSDLYIYIRAELQWLESHNKNYTKEQYHRISTLKDLIEAIDLN